MMDKLDQLDKRRMAIDYKEGDEVVLRGTGRIARVKKIYRDVCGIPFEVYVEGETTAYEPVLWRKKEVGDE